MLRIAVGGPKLAVVMGCGRLGVSVAVALSDGGYDVRMLDTDIRAFDRLPQGLIEGGRVVPAVADGTLESELRKASTQDADLFVAVADADAKNALAAQIAQHILNVPVVICRISDPSRQEMYSQLRLTTVCPTDLATDAIVRSLADQEPLGVSRDL